MLDRRPQTLGHIRPKRVTMRIIAFISDIVFADEFDVLQAERIVDEAIEEMALECVAGLLVAEEPGVGPGLVPRIREVGALKEIRHPANPAL